MLTAAFVVSDSSGVGPPPAYAITTTRTQHQQQQHNASSTAFGGGAMGDTTGNAAKGASICVTDTTDTRAKKEVPCDAVCSSRQELVQQIVQPLVYGIVPRRSTTGGGSSSLDVGPSDGALVGNASSSSMAFGGATVGAAPLYAQGTVVVDGLRAARTSTILDPYNGLLVAAIQALARRDTTKAIFLSAVELDEHNQFIDLLSPDARTQRSASPNVALKAGVLRHQIPSVVEDTTDGFTAIEETTFEDVTRDCHPTLRYLAAKCASDCRHQVYSLVVIHRHGIANTTLQCISHVVHEVTRGTRATRHCVNNAASLLESRSHAISYTSTKILFLLKPILTGKQPGAWVTVLDPATPQADDGSTESFKEAFATMQTLSRISGIGQHGGVPCLLRQLAHHVDPSPPPALSLAVTPIHQHHHHNDTVRSVDTTVRRASRLTEEIDKRFAELTTRSGIVGGPQGDAPGVAARSGGADDADAHQTANPRGQHPERRRDRSSSTSSSDLVPRQRAPQHTPVSMSRSSQQHHPTSVTSSRPPGRRTGPNGETAVGGGNTAKRRSESARQAREMQRRLERLDASERDAGHGPRRGGATLLHLGDDGEAYDDGGRLHVPTGEGRRVASPAAGTGRASAAARPKKQATASPARSSPYRVQHDEASMQVDEEPAHKQQQQAAHSATLLHNYETYKHVMEGALARLRRDLETQSATLDATQKQLRAKERTLRNGNDGLVVTTRDLDAANRKIRALEEAEQAATAEHQRQKASWRSQRLELVKGNDVLQHKVNDLLETINGLEGVLSKSREAASSRTRGLTLSTTTMTTVSGLVHLTHDAAMMRLAHEHVGASGGSGSPLRRGVTSASSSTHSITVAAQRGGGASTPPPQGAATTVGIPRGTQTTFPTVTEMQDAMSEKDDVIVEQSERIQQLSHDLDVMRSREHSLHQRIHELEHDVSALEEREISVKTSLLKTEQVLRVERQEAERQRRDREVNCLSIACQATPPPELQDILINDLEATNKRLMAQVRSLVGDAQTKDASLASEQAAHAVTSTQLQDARKALSDAAAASQAAHDEASTLHGAQVAALEDRIYVLEHMLEERQGRSTNVSPQSEDRTSSHRGSGLDPSRSSSAGAHRGDSRAAAAMDAPLGDAVHVPTVYKRHADGQQKRTPSDGRAASVPRRTGGASPSPGHADRTPSHRGASQASSQSPSPPIAVRMRHQPSTAAAGPEQRRPAVASGSTPRQQQHATAVHAPSVGSTLVASPTHHVHVQDHHASATALPPQARLPSNRDHAALVSPSPTSPTAVVGTSGTHAAVRTPLAARATSQSMQSPNTLFTSYMSRGAASTTVQQRPGTAAAKKPAAGRSGGGGGILGGMRR